jgi:hypothetical protein
VAASDDWPTWLREAKPGTKGATASARPVRDKSQNLPITAIRRREVFSLRCPERIRYGSLLGPCKSRLFLPGLPCCPSADQSRGEDGLPK